MGESVGVGDDVSVNKIPADEDDGGDDEDDEGGAPRRGWAIVLIILSAAALGVWRMIELLLGLL